MEPAQVKRFTEMGAWLGRYGDSIYGTRGGPFILGSLGGSTYKNNRIYLHIFEWPSDTISLPPISRRITACSVFTGGKLSFTQTGNEVKIDLPQSKIDRIDTIIAIDLDGPVATIKPVRVVFSALSTGKAAQASNVYTNDVAEYGPDKAVDDDYGTRWATDAGVTSAWLQVDLGKQTTFDRISIDEAGFDRVRLFELQSKDSSNGEWQTFYRGTTVGENYVAAFSPVSARYVRFNILKSTDGPTISEFRVLSGSKSEGYFANGPG
jgi:alpha-L-fucosidase